MPQRNLVMSASRREDQESTQSSVKVVTFMNEFRPAFGYLQVSAAAHGLHPSILGYGERAWWPEGLGVKINALRRYVFDVARSDEVVLFVDAFDVMVFANSSEIMRRFEDLERRTKRSIVFNAEGYCYPEFDDICNKNYPEAPFPQWKHLNSGLFIGRVSAMREMLKDPVDDIMAGGDQTFYQRYFLRHPDQVVLDTRCEVVCAASSISPSYGVTLSGRRLRNNVTKTEPSVVHFQAHAHWPRWSDGRPTTDLGEVFRSVYPSDSERLFDRVEYTARASPSHVATITFRDVARERYFALMRVVLCIQCQIFGSGDRECEYVPGLHCDMCHEFRILFAVGLLLAFLASLALLRCMRGRSKALRQKLS